MINRALRLLRTYHRFSQVSLAKKLGISNSYLSEIESGSKHPSYDLLEKYASVFKMPISTIMLFSESVQNGKKSTDNVRISAADKILRLLEWIEDSDEIKKQA
ncbi:MAG: helix-turn-helix domain-containing protein [Candidatus Thiodiazotropha sp. (ex. Lucinisca nassula)]|nr:helix-turn-helix domain-containing protein [Candidatus Thiodiazotropha sp. (ex. Lucinisca nassula)]MBW9275653.1 helix-turn-helix domain-containing protein [Candidatus Thiodiazotropha sp. (ex. Lucinisca nassula)]